MTNNPTNLQILGVEGRRQVLKEVAEPLDFQGIKTIFPEIDEFDQLKQEIEQVLAAQQQQMAPPGQVPAEKPQKLDNAGQPMSGQNSRLFLQNDVPQARASLQ